MKREILDELLERLRSISLYTLRGGNDPEDKGNVKQALAEVIDVLSDLLSNMPEERS